jgi:hypothetical protein
MAGEIAANKKGVHNPSDFYTEVERGRVPGHSIVHKFGHAKVGTTMVPITNSLVYQTPTTPVSLEFLSDDANDTALGTGAREITFTGIDINYDEVTFTIPTDGENPVALPTDLLRLYRWYVSASGVYATLTAGSHVGTLTVRVAGVGATWSIIEPTPFPASQSEIAIYTVPNGVRAYIVEQDISVDSAKSVEVSLFRRTGIDNIVAPFDPMRVVVHYVGISGGNPHDFRAPIDHFTARTDFGYMGKISNGTADITIHFSILLIEDGY